jgi:hypothetical protein
MSGLVKYEEGRFQAIAKDSQIALAMRENMQPGDTFSMGDLIRVKTPGAGGLQWAVEEQTGTQYYPDLTGVLVFNCFSGLLWKSLDLDPDNAKPLVVSDDLQVGRLNVPWEEVPEEFVSGLKSCELKDQPGFFDWTKLPWTQFGTGKKGLGKFAREGRTLFLLREGDAWPLRIRCGAGSLRPVSQFIRRLTVPQYRAVVKLSLKSERSQGNIEFSQIVPTLVGVLSEEEGAAVKSMYTDRLRESHRRGDVVTSESADVAEG